MSVQMKISEMLDETEWDTTNASIEPTPRRPELGLPTVVAALGVANALVAAYNKGKADCGG